jgi:hypothetical protein
VVVVAVNEATATLVDELVERGYTRHTIARILNARQVPTASGRGQWWPATVAAVLDGGAYRRAYMRAYRAQAREDWGR